MNPQNSSSPAEPALGNPDFGQVTIEPGTTTKPNITPKAGKLFAGWYTTADSALQNTSTAVLFDGKDTATTIYPKYMDAQSFEGIGTSHSGK